MQQPIIKQCNEDFIVHEVPLLPQDMSMNSTGARHTIIELSKNGYTTFEAMRIISTFFGVDKTGIHCEGLKDEDGVTTQTISILGIHQSDRILEFSKEHAELSKGWVSLLVKGYSEFPVVEKRLHSNVFTVTMRNLTKENARIVQSFCQKNSDLIYLNYYDQQRFGLPGGPYVAHHLGKAIIEEAWDTAKQVYVSSRNALLDFPEGLPKDFSVKKLDIRKLQFFVSSYSSAKWNIKLSNQITGGNRFTIFDDFAVNSIGDITSPMPLLLSETGYYIGNDHSISNRIKHRAATFSTTVYCSEITTDTLNKGNNQLVLDFVLPTGSYATMLIKQLLSTCNLAQPKIGV